MPDGLNNPNGQVKELFMAHPLKILHGERALVMNGMGIYPRMEVAMMIMIMGGLSLQNCGGNFAVQLVTFTGNIQYNY